nr:hypothetical protein CFP56_49615 [Quercus suber]
MQLWAKFLAANERDWSSGSAVQTLSWSPPPPGFYKVNVDAATFKDTRATGGKHACAHPSMAFKRKQKYVSHKWEFFLLLKSFIPSHFTTEMNSNGCRKADIRTKQ